MSVMREMIVSATAPEVARQEADHDADRHRDPGGEEGDEQ